MWLCSMLIIWEYAECGWNLITALFASNCWGNFPSVPAMLKSRIGWSRVHWKLKWIIVISSGFLPRKIKEQNNWHTLHWRRAIPKLMIIILIICLQFLMMSHLCSRRRKIIPRLKLMRQFLLRFHRRPVRHRRIRVSTRNTLFCYNLTEGLEGIQMALGQRAWSLWIRRNKKRKYGTGTSSWTPHFWTPTDTTESQGSQTIRPNIRDSYWAWRKHWKWAFVDSKWKVIRI
mmetsp:Transcript_31348/g.65426  ORF Transcript_31348/g.65426 Transcript_31348/m.65426 type:complete len:230 (-) Transcript_31348:441-1130(-)